ncbi:MAG TPA: hypothetical protein VJP59_05220 [Gemmatimonadota bacterium]|nr:hypothetical protein [Gemmatimonadota bacterium]
MGILRGALAAAIALMTAVACSTETELTIRAVGQNAEGEAVPLSGVQLDILPYDIDSLYAVLEVGSNPGPPPSADSIRGLAQVYQDACASYRVTGDSIEAVRQQATEIANREGQTSDAYRAAFERYQALVAREEQRFDACQNVTDDYTSERNAYREARSEWEERAWPEEAFVQQESLLVAERPIQRVETDPQGTATVTVPNGTWWVLGDAPVPGSISQEYRWNERIEAGGGALTVQLSPETADLEPVF